MTIANTFASKLFVGVVAIAMALSLVAPAQAQTEAELQAQIDQLMATIAALQAQVGQTPAGASSAAVCPYAWTRSLSSGSTGADVMTLQKFLNSDIATQVASAGAAGSAGMETQYYGPATAAAVSNFQVKYRDEILTPNGLVNPTGFFGPSSLAKANALCSTAAPVAGGDDDDDDTTTGGGSVTLRGEGVLATFEVDDDEDEIQEGAEDEVVMIITAEADDGDIRVDRMNFSLVADGGNTEKDPWDTFEEVTLWVDGDRIARFAADDEDNYLNEDNGTFRFSSLGLVLEEDEEVEIMVAVTVQGTVKGAGTAADWVIDVTGLRYFDADGVATDETDVGELADAGLPFSIVEEGTDDEADIESSKDNPDATTLLINDNSKDSAEYTVHIFDIEIGRDSSDLVLDDAFVWVTVENPAGAVNTTIDKVVADIYLEIDGERVKGKAVNTGTGNTQLRHVIGASDSNRAGYRFEFDGLDLESDTDYEAEVSIIFAGTRDGADYENTGVIVTTDVVGSEWEVEGLADDNVLDGTDSSNEHTLATVVPVISDTSFSVDRNDASTAGTISFEFTIEADGNDDLFLGFADVADVQTTGESVTYSLTTGGGTPDYTASITKVSGDATASSTEGWIIEEGDEATFVVDFVFTSTSTAGAYRVTIGNIAGEKIDLTSGALNLID